MYRIIHRTTYRYAEPATLCHNVARLLPRGDRRQSVVESRIEIRPRPASYAEREDYFGNRVSYFSVEEPHRELAVTMTSRVRILSPSQPLPPIDPPWEIVRDHVAAPESSDAAGVREFVLESPHVSLADGLSRYAAVSFEPRRPLLDAVADLVSRMHEDFTYEPGSTSITTPIEEVLAYRRGVCQDFAHLAIGFLRSLGLPARYVSGYLETVPPPGEQKLVGADASHAWFAVFVPGFGWCDFDPTNASRLGLQHVTTAVGRDYADVPPLKGILFGGGSEQRLSVSVDVERVET